MSTKKTHRDTLHIFMHVAVTWHAFLWNMCFKVHCQGIFCAGDFYVASPFVAGLDLRPWRTVAELTVGSRPATWSDRSNLTSNFSFLVLGAGSDRCAHDVPKTKDDDRCALLWGLVSWKTWCRRGAAGGGAARSAAARRERRLFTCRSRGQRLRELREVARRAAFVSLSGHHPGRTAEIWNAQILRGFYSISRKNIYVNIVELWNLEDIYILYCR